jgi:hypothetical protein
MAGDADLTGFRHGQLPVLKIGKKAIVPGSFEQQSELDEFAGSYRYDQAGAARVELCLELIDNEFIEVRHKQPPNDFLAGLRKRLAPLQLKTAMHDY